MVISGHEAAFPRGKNPVHVEQNAGLASELVCRLWRKISYSAEK